MFHLEDGIGQRNLRLMLAAFALLALPAQAAERSLSVTSFERIRVEGPFAVTLTTNRAPSARADGDAAAIEALDIRVEGATLIVRSRQAATSERPRPRGITNVAVTTPRLVSANVVGGGTLQIDGPLTAPRIDLSINGAGALSASAVASDQLNATLTGTGTITLAGRAQRARLMSSGSGAVAADKLVAGELIVRAEGNGTTKAAARFTADVTTTGLGEVIVIGTPACTVKAMGGGPISCGR